MKLGICCNFSYPSVGGSEIVIDHIALMMYYKYGMDVTIFSFSVQVDTSHDFATVSPCKRGESFLRQINDLDHIFIYSDSFWEWKTILGNIDRVKPTISIVLLGMYDMLSNEKHFNLFKENRKKIRVITHSNNYQDYKKCFKEGIPVTVIPNGVDKSVFDRVPPDFKLKYGITTDYMLLNVGNFFYGKGQEYLADIGEKLAEKRYSKDFTIVSISNSVKYPHEQKLLDKTIKMLAVKSQPRQISMIKRSPGFEYKVLRNIPREDVLKAFCYSDVFVFTSTKEVAPLVLLESMASNLPWISLDVGNAETLVGGEVIKCRVRDGKTGHKIFNETLAEKYADWINHYLTKDREALTDYIDKIVEDKYNWDNICEQYYNIFIS